MSAQQPRAQDGAWRGLGVCWRNERVFGRKPNEKLMPREAPAVAESCVKHRETRLGVVRLWGAAEVGRWC